MCSRTSAKDKVALFFLAFVPQFAEPGVGILGLLTLRLTFTLLPLAIFSLLGSFSGVGNWIWGRPGFANALRWLTGSVLIGLSLRLALPERR